MIIIPHKDFNQLGLDFVLRYYDDPKARIPNMAYKWMATSGLPDWLDKLHEASRRISKEATTDDYSISKTQHFYLNEEDAPKMHSDAHPVTNETNDEIKENAQVEADKNVANAACIKENNEVDSDETFKRLTFMLHDFESDPHPSFS